MSIAPLPTEYLGIEYRSRLEARWAVFLTALGLRFHYEYNGYQLPSGRYLPDFFVPLMRRGIATFQEEEIGVFIEIKATDPPAGNSLTLCRELASAMQREVWLFAGPPDDEMFIHAFNPEHGRGPLPTVIEHVLLPLQDRVFNRQRYEQAIFRARRERFGH